MKKALLTLSFAVFFCSNGIHAQTIFTIAGNDPDAYTDGVEATSVKLSGPWAVAVDDDGNIFFSEPNKCVVKKIDTHGIITTVAGKEGVIGNMGNGIPATNAELNMPYGITVDHSGNLYIADTKNGLIRKVNAAGIISTIAYNMYNPFDLALDTAGNLYVSDASHYAIKKIKPNGSVSTVIDGFSYYLPPGTYGYTGDLWHTDNSRLSGVVVDKGGNLYIADYWDNIIRKVQPNGNMSTISGKPGLEEGSFSGDGGPAKDARLNGPKRITLDNDGNIVFSDRTNSRIRKIDNEGVISTIVGAGYGYSGDAGHAENAKMTTPIGVAYDKAGNLYIADNGNNCIRKVTPHDVGLQAVSKENNIRILPNPNRGTFTITGIAGNMNSADIEVMDMAGNVVYNGRVAVQNNSINTGISLSSSLANGTYLLRVKVGSETSAYPFVVER